MRAYDRRMATDDGIAIVVLTHNRAHLVSKCVENVLLRTSDATREIVIWDNASTDGTAEYLALVDDPRVRVIRSEQNVGQNGYARAFRETTSPYLIELDDDVMNAPAGWDRICSTPSSGCPTSGSWPPTSRTTRTTSHRAFATTSARTSTRWWRSTA